VTPAAAGQSSAWRSECNCLALRQAARHVTQFYDQCLSPSGLRSTQYSILVRLNRNGPMSINALASELVMDRTTLGRNIQPLDRDGLITIVKDDADRRRKALRLTPAGAERMRVARSQWAAAQARFEAVFGDRRAADLRDLLGAVVTSELGASVDASDLRA
jgi:DNA-binding MarR family transcriptional regulator